MANTELNYRYWNKAVVEAELILGVRYIDLQEKLRIYTGDDVYDASIRNRLEQLRRHVAQAAS